MGFKAAPQSDHLLKLVYQFSIAACIRLHPRLTALIAVAGFASLAIDNTMTTFVLSTLAPMTPVMIWVLRECNRQAATCELLDRLNEEVKKLWDHSRREGTEQEISMRSRELQDAIYNHRASSPLIFDWVYSLLRRKMEERMNAGADHWVSELRAAGETR